MTIAIGGLQALVVGDPAAPPVVFLHGFPDHPPTALPFLRALAARGRRVIAPWLRGYAPSPLAGPYDAEALAGDLLAVIDDAGPKGAPVDVVGHDWGAVITYAACALAPTRIRRAVTLAVPHPATFLAQLATSAQLWRSGYMLRFQLPGAARRAAAGDFAYVDALWRRWSPGFALSAAERAALHGCLAASWPAPLLYYRALLRPPGGIRRQLALARTALAVPTLQLHGADDGCIGADAPDDGRWFAAPRVREVVPGAGHFLHVERPAAIAARVSDFLSSNIR
jgi:pimeloyl-ACP methyl ester carboxylesterase